MPEGMVFPYGFGFVPATKAERWRSAGRAAAHRRTALSGCLVDCRLIGAIEAEQEGKKQRNDRLVGVGNQIAALFKY